MSCKSWDRSCKSWDMSYKSWDKECKKEVRLRGPLPPPRSPSPPSRADSPQSRSGGPSPVPPGILLSTSTDLSRSRKPSLKTRLQCKDTSRSSSECAIDSLSISGSLQCSTKPNFSLTFLSFFHSLFLTHPNSAQRARKITVPITPTAVTSIQWQR